MSKLMELVDALRRESSNATFDNIVGRNPYPAREREAAVLEQLSAAVHELERDAAIGRLVREKLTSGNSVPVERCTVRADEVVNIDRATNGGL